MDDLTRKLSHVKLDYKSGKAGKADFEKKIWTKNRNKNLHAQLVNISVLRFLLVFFDNNISAIHLLKFQLLFISQM